VGYLHGTYFFFSISKVPSLKPLPIYGVVANPDGSKSEAALKDESDKGRQQSLITKLKLVLVLPK
jgi:hypothetical protein